MGYIRKVMVDSSFSRSEKFIGLIRQIDGMVEIMNYIDESTLNEFHIFKYKDTKIHFCICSNHAHSLFTYSVSACPNYQGLVYWSGSNTQGTISYNSGIWTYANDKTELCYVPIKNGIYISPVEGDRHIIIWEEDDKVYTGCNYGTFWNVYCSYLNNDSNYVCQKITYVCPGYVEDSSNLSRSVITPYFWNTTSSEFSMYSKVLCACLNKNVASLPSRTSIYLNGVPYIKINNGGFCEVVQVSIET